MRKLTIAAMALCATLAAVRSTDAGTITYSIVNYPADQNGASLSGTIVTDGKIGALAASDIVSWNWTIIPAAAPGFSRSSSDAGAYTFVYGSVVASLSEITVAAVGNDLAMFNTVIGGDLEYDRIPSNLSYYFGTDPSFAGPWTTVNPGMGGNEPWVIATVSVPEPSSCILTGLAAVCMTSYGAARYRRRRLGAATA